MLHATDPRPAPARIGRGAVPPRRKAALRSGGAAVIALFALAVHRPFRYVAWEEGGEIDPEDLAHISTYLTERLNRFGEHSTRELGIRPDAYDPEPGVDFTPLREQDPTAAGLGQAA